MFSLSLLFALIGCVLSSEHPSADRTTLLGRIRQDPNALLSIFDTADQDKLNTILKLLNNLINEANAEIDDINQAQVICRGKVKNATDVLNVAIADEKVFKGRYDAAARAAGQAQGVYDESLFILNRESPALTKEIAVFKKVIKILRNLLDSGKNLAEEDSSEVRAFISLADQADPAKVQKVIDLVDKLLRVSLTELAALQKTVQDAQAALGLALEAKRVAYGRWVASQAAVVGAKRLLNQIQGACTQAATIGNARKVVLNEEIKTLNSVITLLKQVNQ